MNDSEVAHSGARHRSSREPVQAITPLPDGAPAGSSQAGVAPEASATPQADRYGALFHLRGHRGLCCSRVSRASAPDRAPRRNEPFIRSLLLPHRGTPGCVTPAAGTEVPAAQLRTVHWASSPDALRGPPR
ncbi:hypothetical protein [Streptomyces sp. NPDC020742]|uniref:hypothetical protein n=1 Tax=Streptomyces sp. NPDC020742 TaxID=3154897 RepID=UPI0033F81B05